MGGALQMGRIFYMMGKSSSGKDTIFKRVKEQLPQLRTIVLYTTRPIRGGETDGVEYFFVDQERLAELEREGRVIERRTYHTVHGDWSYFTVDDGQIDLKQANYLVIGTLESYAKMQAYFGARAVCPIYIEVEDGVRLERALRREQAQPVPKYAEMCRRFLADTEDFSEENLRKCGIDRRYQNDDIEKCVREIVLGIQEKM